jgi:4-aminobutyrate aminotransferase-like enzyme
MASYLFSRLPISVETVQTEHRIVKTKLPTQSALITLSTLDKYESRSMHGQLPIVWDKAIDFSIFDSEGNKWIDFTSTIFVANVGHANELVSQRVKAVIDNQLVSSYAYSTAIRAEYCKRLVEFAGGKFEKVFLLSAGTEATEAAVKLMKLNGKKKGKNRNLVIAISGNWHGRTMAAQLLSDNLSQKDWINENSDETVHIPFPYPWDVDEENGADFLDRSFEVLVNNGIDLNTDISGVMLETFQGWGAFFYPSSFVKRMREICDRYGILLCFDEMQAGFGRTGKKFGYEHYGVNADLICCGKGMGGGFPVSGVIGSAEVMDLPEVGNMSSTHSGNPIVCAAGIAVLDEIENKDLIFESARKGTILHRELNELRNEFPKLVSAIYGKGLIASVIFDKSFSNDLNRIVSKIAETCFQKGLLVVHTGRESIKIGPPLTITDNAIIEGVSVLRESILQQFNNEPQIHRDVLK